MALNEMIKENIGKLRQKPLAFIGLIIILLGGAFYFVTGSVPGLSQPEVAATVNGEKILKQDYQTNLKSQQDFYNKTYPNLLKQKASEQILKNLPGNVIDKMVQQVLLTQFLDKKGIKVTTEQAKEQAYKEVVSKTYGGSWNKYEKELAKTYTTVDQAINNFKMDLIVKKVSEIEKLDVTSFGDWYKKLKTEAIIKIYVKI